jgi:tRNA(fMet)-specific endonuclease VapC
MSSVVVDTDVVSFVFKNHPIGRQYDADLADRTLIVSFMTLAELDRWTIQSKWSEARRNWLRLYWNHSSLCHMIAPFAQSGPR